jgi:hypothetical protein
MKYTSLLLVDKSKPSDILVDGNFSISYAELEEFFNNCNPVVRELLGVEFVDCPRTTAAYRLYHIVKYFESKKLQENKDATI